MLYCGVHSRQSCVWDLYNCCFMCLCLSSQTRSIQFVWEGEEGPTGKEYYTKSKGLAAAGTCGRTGGRHGLAIWHTVHMAARLLCYLGWPVLFFLFFFLHWYDWAIKPIYRPIYRARLKTATPFALVPPIGRKRQCSSLFPNHQPLHADLQYNPLGYLLIYGVQCTEWNVICQRWRKSAKEVQKRCGKKMKLARQTDTAKCAEITDMFAKATHQAHPIWMMNAAIRLITVTEWLSIYLVLINHTFLKYLSVHSHWFLLTHCMA